MFNVDNVLNGLEDDLQLLHTLGANFGIVLIYGKTPTNSYIKIPYIALRMTKSIVFRIGLSTDFKNFWINCALM